MQGQNYFMKLHQIWMGSFRKEIKKHVGNNDEHQAMKSASWPLARGANNIKYLKLDGNTFYSVCITKWLSLVTRYKTF